MVRGRRSCPPLIIRTAQASGTPTSTPTRVTLCPVTTDPTDAPLFRLLIEPGPGNGLDVPSRIMADKVTTVRPSRLGAKAGVLDDTNVLRLNRALVVFLGIASSADPSRQ